MMIMENNLWTFIIVPQFNWLNDKIVVEIFGNSSDKLQQFLTELVSSTSELEILAAMKSLNQHRGPQHFHELGVTNAIYQISVDQ